MFTVYRRVAIGTRILDASPANRYMAPYSVLRAAAHVKVCHAVPCALYMWYWLKCLSSIRQIIIVLPHSSAEGNETRQGHGPYLTRYNSDNRSLSMQYDTRILFLCHSKRTLDDLLDGPVSKGRKDRPALSTSPLDSLWNNLVVCQFLQYVPCLPRGISHWPSVRIEQKSDSWWTMPWGNHESLQEKRQKAVSRFGYIGQTGFYS